jgi:hypothetical protein
VFAEWSASERSTVQRDRERGAAQAGHDLPSSVTKFSLAGWRTLCS